MITLDDATLPDAGSVPSAIPVIDLFAGPGGLGEGFSSIRDARNRQLFRIALSVEVDPVAHRTLELRAFYRQFTDATRPDAYYRYLEDPRPEARTALFAAFPQQAGNARSEAWCHRLSSETAQEVTARAKKALGRHKTWVLIGGPPCQAYSLAGRSRRANDESFASDAKHTLYEHYLRLIEDLEPPIFVMENVKGILSAKLDGLSTIDRVLADLRHAGSGYDIYSFVRPTSDPQNLEPQDFVIRAEDYGVPQARHRVILLGVRRGFKQHSPHVLAPSIRRVSTAEVIADLPRLRSRLSHRTHSVPDGASAWLEVLETGVSMMNGADAPTRRRAESAIEAVRAFVLSQPEQAKQQPSPSRLRLAHEQWYKRDTRAPSNMNHESRSHMPSDLARYLFSASFASVWGFSPKLSDFPRELLPAHANVAAGVEGHFADRFRVQLKNAPATTVTSHISKDGHYYIHYDPSQCRSLSVREAARLQTFPDDYYFEGNRTQQYHQVGNAVPPLLAAQLAQVVVEFLRIPACRPRILVGPRPIT